MQDNLLLAIFVLLVATVALVPLFKSTGLGTILGYLTTGILIGPFGLGLISDSDVVRHIAEYGIVMMLFLIGLELQPLELWRMRAKVMGLGVTQYVGTALLIALLASALGLSGGQSLVIGLALAMSSTAIALQSIASRGIMPTDTGRGSLAILLVQDIAVIPVLAIIPFLAIGAIPATEAIEGAIHKGASDWTIAAKIIAVFAGVMLGSRFVVRPAMRYVARTGVREAFTALGLALVVGATLTMQWIGLSPALGAFMGGVLLADSEYRHELESTLEPFKGLLLGLFFISVGTSIAFDVVVAQPLHIFSLVFALVAIKALVLFGLTTAFRMHLGDRILLSLMLSQSGEFAFVLLQFAQNNRALSSTDAGMLTVVVALSMAMTPVLLFAFDRFVAPRIGTKPKHKDADGIDRQNKVIVLGYGRFGQIVTRLLRAQGFEMTLIDDDPAQIELVKRFGVHVFYGDGGRLDLLHAAGAANAELIVIAVAGRERITAIAKLVKRHFPHVKIAARAAERSHAHELMDIGVDVFERETFASALALGQQTLGLLGYSERRAARLATAFAKHDLNMLKESYELRGDDDAYIGYMRRSTDMLAEVMRADLGEAEDEEGASEFSTNPAQPGKNEE